MLFVPGNVKERQADLSQFQACLGFIVSLKPVRDILWDPVSSPPNNHKKRKCFNGKLV